MNTVDFDKKALFSGLEEDVRNEIEKLREETDHYLSERRKSLEKQVSSILEEARKKADAQVQSIKKTILGGVSIEIKRNIMKMREDVFSSLIKNACEKLASKIGTPSYNQMLVDWIAEAAAGLDSPVARVNASSREKALLTTAILEEAEKKAGALTGKNITLTIDKAEPLSEQGIIVTSVDGRTAFNNQAKTRINRKTAEIYSFMQNELFGGSD